MPYNLIPAVDENYNFPPKIVKAITDPIKEIEWLKETDIFTNDLNLYTKAGVRMVSRQGVLNRPYPASGVLEVMPPSGTIIVQRWSSLTSPVKTYTRTSNDNGTTWSQWEGVDWAKAGIPKEIDLDTVVSAGAYPLANSNANAPTVKPGILEVLLLGTVGVVQRYTTNQNPPSQYVRYRASGVWGVWSRVATDSDIKALSDKIRDTIVTPPTPTSPTEYNQVIRAPIAAWVPSLESKPAFDYPASMSKDRTKGWNAQSTDLKETYDGGKTWKMLKTFTDPVSWVREMDNGELILSTGTSNGDAPRKIWVSKGYPQLGAQATWASTLSASAPKIYFAISWSFSMHDNIVLLNEYGPKYPAGDGVVEGQNARYTYLSLDYGKTWKTVFDLNAWVGEKHGPDFVKNIHLHGVAWDPYWDRIWITYGDDVNGTCFSDDLGKTWTSAHISNQAYSLDQNVGIACLPQRILFGTDTAPNGVMAFDRSEGKKKGLYTLRQAFTIPGDDGTTRTHLCHAIHRVPQKGGDVWLFGFGCETNSDRSVILATRDGWSWKTFWEDSVKHPVGKGLRSIAGPGLDGVLYVGSDDMRSEGVWSVWSGEFTAY